MCLLSFLQSKNNDQAKEIGENLYVDNILLSANTPSKALKKYHESKALLAMNLREYVSNSNEVNSAIPIYDRTPSGIIKLLGVTYNTESDEFTLELKFPDNKNVTKRDVLSQLNSIYDPLGIAAPLTIHLKHLMREIYDRTIEWKEPESKDLADIWNDTCSKTNSISLSAPRFPFEDYIDSFSLWVFSDASIQALAVCAYFRNEHTVKVSPLTSGKTRLTPKKIKQTIPKLELLAILMAARLGKTTTNKNKKPVSHINILSDSEIALSWVTSKGNLPLFVENQRYRIMKVKQAVKTQGMSINFWHVPSDKNPADAGTRGTDSEHIHQLPWILGPNWLREAQIPSPLVLKNTTASDTPETQDDDPADTHTTSLHVANTSPPDSPAAQGLLSLARFSRLDKAIRTMTRVRKTICLWVDKVNRRKASSTLLCLDTLRRLSPSWNITADEFSMSETILLADLHKSISVEDLGKRSPQKQVFRDNAVIIRHQSRLQNSVLPEDTKNNIYVDKDSDLARLILSDIHHKNAHSGKDHTLCIARARFWIPRPSGCLQENGKTMRYMHKMARASVRRPGNATNTKGQSHFDKTFQENRMRLHGTISDQGVREVLHLPLHMPHNQSGSPRSGGKHVSSSVFFNHSNASYLDVASPN
ncbi:hypothetical protein V3C99_013054 [Haemonchus contortus]|uniref:Integrase catalytic domain-containing protein n=1 Tax=Haemonchus contortus TaxID=6289 RepID=A0A7I4Y3I6_HAECO